MIAGWIVAVALALQAGQPVARDADLVQGLAFIANGDFVAAEAVLAAVTAKLEGEPRKMGELAEAYLNLAVAQLELERPVEAAHNFFEARRRNRTLALSKYAFSAQVIRAFDEAVRLNGVLPDRSAPLRAAPDAPAAPIEEWVVTRDAGVTLRMALGTAEGKCDGSVTVDAKQFAWSSTEGGPCAAFSVALTAVRPATAASQGGVAISFVGNARPGMVLMPAPSAGYFEAGIEDLARSDLDTNASVQIRVAIRRLNQYIEGGASTGFKESLYGVAVDASLAELMDTPGAFDGSTVRTRGRFEIVSREKNQYMLTAETFTVMISPDPEAGVAALIRSEARDLRGKEVEVTGAFKRRSIAAIMDEKRAPEFEVMFWRFDAEAVADEGPAAGKMTIETLVTSDPPPAAQITVIGKFRGGNLFGDLPYNSRKKPNDWIVKDDIYSLWITGKSPDGDGWRLSIRSTQDSVNWVRVTGTPRSENGFVYLEATSVALSRPPTPVSSVAAAPTRDRIATGRAAEIMFTIPIQNVETAAPDSLFAIQFTKPMDGRSFEGRVRLRYARQPDAPNGFANAAIGYDQIRRVLTVDPGEALLDGRVLECVLLPGIRDSEGIELKGAGTRSPQDPLQVVRWTISAR